LDYVNYWDYWIFSDDEGTKYLDVFEPAGRTLRVFANPCTKPEAGVYMKPSLDTEKRVGEGGRGINEGKKIEMKIELEPVYQHFLLPV
jgi:hypothetical protein